MSPFERENGADFSTCFQLVSLVFKGFPTNLISLHLFFFCILQSVLGGISNEVLTNTGLKADPKFVEEIENVTVTSGREAILSCVVDDLGDYKVGWLKVDSQTILSLQKRVVTHNSRISVTHDEHRTWNLHIRQVKESDRGCYMCQINTPLMKMKVGCIEVYVPPNIIDEKTSSETTINEDDSVTLRCSAVGYPTPTVEWQREDKKHIRIATSVRDFLKKEKVQGENLTLKGVTRKQMGAYFCIAKNGVPPIVSKRIQLNVNFAPVVKVDNQLIGSPLGTEVEIQCHVEAFPLAINYWQRDNSEMILKGRKYNLSEETDSYKSTLKLQIKNFTKNDEGQYKCMSTNSLGKAETTIRLYVITMPSPKSTTEEIHSSQSSTSSPANGVSSLDLRKRQERKRLKNVAFDNLGGGNGGNTLGEDGADPSNKRHHEKHRYNYDFEDHPDGAAGRNTGLFNTDLGLGGASGTNSDSRSRFLFSFLFVISRKLF